MACRRLCRLGASRSCVPSLSPQCADYFRPEHAFKGWAATAVELVRWLRGNILPLGLLREEQQRVYGRTFAPLEPCATRWASQVSILAGCERDVLHFL